MAITRTAIGGDGRIRVLHTDLYHAHRIGRLRIRRPQERSQQKGTCTSLHVVSFEKTVPAVLEADDGILVPHTRLGCLRTALGEPGSRIDGGICSPAHLLTLKSLVSQEYDDSLEYFSSEGMEAMMRQGAIRRFSLCHSCHVRRPVRSKHCR
jgi:hypothetical protein